MKNTSILVVASLCLVGCGSKTKPQEKKPAEVTPTPEKKEEITLEVLTEQMLIDAPRLRGKPGDFLLRNEHLALVVEKTPIEKRRSYVGQPIDLWSPNSADLLEWAGLSVRVGAKPSQAASYTEAEPAADKDQLPYIVATGTISKEKTLTVSTSYKLLPFAPVLQIEHTLHNKGEETVSVSLCQTGNLGNHPAWFPKEGFAQKPLKKMAPWIGYWARGASYVIGPAQEDAEIQSTATVIDEGVFHNGFVMCAPSESLAPDDEISTQWLISFSSQDLAEATADFLEARGEDLGKLQGRVAQQKASPMGQPRELFVEISYEGRPFTRALVGPSSFGARVPVGDITAAVVGDGRPRTSESPATIQKDTPAWLDLPSPEVGLLSVQVLQADQQTPMPARIIVIPEGTSSVTPLLGSYEHPDGAGNSVYSLQGTATVALAPGRYKVLATHGLEYSLPEQSVEVMAGQEAKVSLSLTRVVNTDNAISCDLHLHSIKSKDSDLTLEGRVISLVAEGVELAVATDHDSITDYAPIVSRLGAESFLTTLIGEEITTSEPSLGHFNLFPILPDASGQLPDPVFSFGVTPAALFSQARSLSEGPEIIQVNHPRMQPNIGYFSLLSFDPKTGRGGENFSLDFDTIEVFNGLELSHIDKVDANLKDWYSLLNLGLKKVATGNSDSHQLALQEVGYPRTYVFLPDSEKIDKGAFLEALRTGKAMVTNGPYLQAKINGEGPGAQTKTNEKGEVALEVLVQAAPWIDVSMLEIVVNGEVALRQEVTLQDGSAKLSASLPLAVDSWVVVIARGAKPMRDVLPYENSFPLAFQNPVWVDANKDGSFTAPGNSPASKPAP